jgi:hypothetical protein
MASDPDYIDPAELKRRAAMSGGAGAVSGRPTLRGNAPTEFGISLGASGPRDMRLSGVIFGVGVKVESVSGLVMRDNQTQSAS